MRAPVPFGAGVWPNQVWPNVGPGELSLEDQWILDKQAAAKNEKKNILKNELWLIDLMESITKIQVYFIIF